MANPGYYDTNRYAHGYPNKDVLGQLRSSVTTGDGSRTFDQLEMSNAAMRAQDVSLFLAVAT